MNIEEHETGERFNIRDYLNRTTPSSDPLPRHTLTEPTTFPKHTLPETSPLGPTQGASSATTEKPIGKASISTIKKIYKSKWDGEKSTVKIPKLTIEGVDTSAINKEMSKKFIDVCHILRTYISYLFSYI